MQTDGGARRGRECESGVLMLLSFHEQGGKKRDLERLEHLAAELADEFDAHKQVIALFGLETDFKVSRRGHAENLEADGRRCRRNERQMSLRGGIFNDAVDLFDTKLRDVLNTLLRQGLTEGGV